MREAALAYLKNNPLLYTGMLEPIRRGTVKIYYAGRDGVLLREEKSGAHMLAADTPQLGERLLAGIPTCALMVVHQAFLVKPVKRRFGLRTVMPCRQATYTKKTRLLEDTTLEIRALTQAELPSILTQYKLLSEEELRERIDSGALFGGYDKGVPVGFVGEHAEGSIGMLQVLPAFRRRGYGAALEAYLVNRMLEQGRVPYAQIIRGNDASLLLHQKLGFAVSDELLYWMF